MKTSLPMKTIIDTQKGKFVEACRQAADKYNLVRYSSGNMSWRLGRDRILVTGAGTLLGNIRRNQVAVVSLSNGVLIEGCRPSVETGFHRGILQRRPEQNVVLHYQSTYATVVACSRKIPSDFAVIPEVPYYIGKIAVVPYFAPGSGGLISNVIRAMGDHDLAILRNHGQVVVGRNFDDAIQKAVFFELACEIIIHAAGSHKAMPAVQSAILNAMRKKRSGV